MEPIIFAGTPANAAETLQGLVAKGYEVALVITRADAPFGRKGILTPSPVAITAAQLGIPLLKANKIGPDEEAVISRTGARLAIVVAFGVILKRTAIDLLELGWFNLHYSVLPRWRGASPVQSAILAGDSSTGVSLFKIDSGLDTGDIVGIAETTIEAGETAGRLLSRLTQIGVSLAAQELPGLMSGISQLKNQSGPHTLAPKYDRTAARIESTDSPRKALAKVLAFNPEPIAWLEVKGSPLRVLSALPSLEAVSENHVLKLGDKIFIGLKDSKSIELLQVQPAGKTAMPAADWFRGLKTEDRIYS
jgi:methionyl-tRNA formyltransferase